MSKPRLAPTSRATAPYALAALCALPLLGACAKKDVPAVPEKIVGSCKYTNRFSRGAECRDYHGDWSEDQVREDCADWDGEVTIGQACNLPESLGACVLQKDGRYIRANVPGNDPGSCGSSLRGCEFFGGGAFDPSPICGGIDPDQGGGVTGLQVFRYPEQICKAPKAGEPPGKSAGGQVCTWEMISGATEEGRKFDDYVSCDVVRTQRPYYPVSPAPNATRSDPRMQDPTYTSELGWVRSQIESTACVCCHSTRAPKGPSNWFLESQGNFINSFLDRGIAMGAGWLDTAGLGAYPKEQNNGFSRATPQDPHHTVFVTTDEARMRRFFEAEALARGLKKESYYDVKIVVGPLDEQRYFRPSACQRGEGVTADGRVVWRGGAARYVYVMEESAASPAVPPNLDLPEGSLWRIDVPYTGTPVASGSVRYGEVPQGMTQRHPLMGGPPALQSGKKYYLYVTADVIQPVTRCVFTAP